MKKNKQLDIVILNLVKDLKLLIMESRNIAIEKFETMGKWNDG